MNKCIKITFLLANSLTFRTSSIKITHTPGKTEEIILIQSLYTVLRPYLLQDDRLVLMDFAYC